jgi:hypothetical protein
MKKLKAISILKNHLKKLDTLEIYDRDGMDGRNNDFSPFLKDLCEDVTEIFKRTNEYKIKEYILTGFVYIQGSSFNEIQYNYNIIRHDLRILINSSIKEINKWESSPEEKIIENINNLLSDIKSLYKLEYSRFRTNPELKRFIEKCKRFLKKNYHEPFEKLKEFNNISFTYTGYIGMDGIQVPNDTIVYKDGLIEVRTLLEIIVDEIDDGSFLFSSHTKKEEENISTSITSDILEVDNNTVTPEIAVNPMHGEVPPKVFISYACGEEQHQDWVLKLSQDLRENGVDTILDKYEILAGRNLHYFMENSLEIADKVLIILTKEYKDKALARTKGVGVEYSIITSEISENIADNIKYIPILRGQKDESTPMFLKQYNSIYMVDNEKYNKKLKELLHSIFEKPIIQKPEIGQKPDYLKSKTI